MTRDEQEAYDKGKFAAWIDYRDRASGSRSRCPHNVANRVRAWQQGYTDQTTTLNPKAQLDAEAEQRRLDMVAALQDWLARNAK